MQTPPPISVPRDLVKTLARLPGIVESYTASIPEAEWDVQRSAEAWTLREHLYHIVSVQEMLLGRMRLIRDADKPVITPFFPENQPSTAELYPSLEAALEQYRDFRQKQLKLLRGCRPRDWKKQAVHPEYQQYSLPILVHHLVFHEYWHLYRMEEIWLTRDEYFH